MKNLNPYKMHTLLIALLIISSISRGFAKYVITPPANNYTDTTRKIKTRHEDDDATPSLKSILNDELKSYKEITRVSSAFKLSDGRMMKVKLKHYCTYDGKINLPGRYLRMYHLSKFKTHNFVTALEISINSKPIFEGVIKKQDFISKLDDELKKYAVLLYPNVEFKNNKLAIHYSISIPLSDVGKGFTMQIDSNGKKYITED